MDVELIAHTPDATKKVAQAAHICTHEDWPTEYDLHPDRSGPLVRRVLSSGHDSVLEHASFSFAVDGISRACSHQLVRHRIASFSQQSMRYVSLAESLEVVVPQVILDTSSLLEKYGNLMDHIHAVYLELLDAGIPAEDARFVLPNAAATKIVITMNARELHHFFSLRCCIRAQWEIRAMANKMLLLCSEAAPILFEQCGPGCARGECPEGKLGCGYKRSKQ
jgi:thymidylate synthase (FAD)